MRDEFEGVGGSYVVDDATQTRRRIDASIEALPPTEPEPAAPATPDQLPAKE